MEKDDNIETDSIDSYVIEDESPNYFRITDNLKYEYNILLRLKTVLKDANAISVSDIETLIGYRKDIDELMVLLMDYHHTLSLLNEFDKTFKLREVNAARFVIKIRMDQRRKKRKISRRYREKLKI